MVHALLNAGSKGFDIFAWHLVIGPNHFLIITTERFTTGGLLRFVKVVE